MTRRSRLTAGVVVTALLAAGAASGGGSASAAPDPGTGPEAALQRLARDGGGRLTVAQDRDGTVTFVGVPAGVSVDNPAAKAGQRPAVAARAHLDRYAAALGTDRPGSSLVETSARTTVSGNQVVRFSQQVGGLPVIGGEVSVDLRPGNRLGSVLATVSDAATAPAAAVRQAAAARTARRVVAKAAPDVTLAVTTQGRWLFDPAVFHAASPQGARGVWRFEVGDGAGVRRLVLIDDQTGAVALSLDLIHAIDRVVCDANNVPVSSESTCSSGFARTESSGPSGVSDVNDAFDLAGAVSDYYDQIGGLDLTDLLGVTIGAGKKLASTVRFCFSGSPCPYANAFWNGTQMYYGEGFAVADDVVGHEMTHGVIDQYSELFYWHQSGAINESLADIMGEIVDHRHVLEAADADWEMGEDLSIGAIRSMADPTIFGDPDRMTSPNYWADPGYTDNGGVHINSGVGNKTAYLISQGGSFNGQTITGIDTGDPTLTKTATLYLDVIQSLTSGSDYADLARVLDQSCQDLIGTAGFTAADCTAVHQATLATELTTTPPPAAQPADAPDACTGGLVKRVLFDSEKGAAGSKFTHGSNWGRVPGLVGGYIWPSNATSGRASWFGFDAPVTRTDSMVAAGAVKLPAGQQSYLWFQHWRLFDYSGTTYYDGGTVEVDDLSTAAGPVDTAGLPWVNGPSQTLVSPNSGRIAFAGDSDGYISSRLNLSSFAGKKVKPQFTLRTDSSVAYYGWFLDDIRIYTCDPPFITAAKPKIKGTPKVGKRLKAVKGTWTPGALTFSYKWFRGAKKIKGATNVRYRLVKADRGKRIRVKVTAKRSGYTTVSAKSKPTKRVRR